MDAGAQGAGIMLGATAVAEAALATGLAAAPATGGLSIPAGIAVAGVSMVVGMVWGSMTAAGYGGGS